MVLTLNILANNDPCDVILYIYKYKYTYNSYAFDWDSNTHELHYDHKRNRQKANHRAAMIHPLT